MEARQPLTPPAHQMRFRSCPDLCHHAQSSSRPTVSPGGLRRRHTSSREDPPQTSPARAPNGIPSAREFAKIHRERPRRSHSNQTLLSFHPDLLRRREWRRRISFFCFFEEDIADDISTKRESDTQMCTNHWPYNLSCQSTMGIDYGVNKLCTPMGDSCGEFPRSRSPRSLSDCINKIAQDKQSDGYGCHTKAKMQLMLESLGYSAQRHTDHS